MSDNRTLDYTMEVAVRPENKVSPAELERFLIELAERGLGCSAQLVSDVLIVRGMDEVHLEEAIALFASEIGCSVEVGAFQVCHRETVRTATMVDQTQVSPYKAPGQRVGLKIAIEPLSPGTGCRVQNSIVDDDLPAGLVAELETAMHDLFRHGGPMGASMRGVKITLMGISHSGLRPAAEDLRLAARTAFAEAVNKAGTLLLEPVAIVEICTPDEEMAVVLSDLFQRRIWLQGSPCERNGWTTIRAHVPVANMFGYAETLARMTHDRGTYRMEAGHYQRVPRRVPDDTARAEPEEAVLQA